MMGLLIADPWTQAKCLSSLIRAENFKNNKINKNLPSKKEMRGLQEQDM